MAEINNTKKPKFLVLDDELLTAQTISQMAMVFGYDSTFTTEPTTFFEMINDWAPDIIAIDLMMPEMDGVQVMEQLAKEDCRAKLIITSGVGGKILTAAGLSAEQHGLDIVGILSKPFSSAKFSALLKGSAVSPPSFTFESTKLSNKSTPTPTEISEAIKNNDIQVVYQPKIYCKTGTLAGFEALARWQHPEHGNIPPDVFVIIAEQNLLIDELTRVVAKQALDWLSSVSSEDYANKIGFHTFQNLKLSLNISASSIKNKALFGWLFDYCEEKRIDPNRLVLELTETSAMQDPTPSLDNLTRLRMRGFHLSIDDFGTGYSSMAQLVRLPFSEIKVDKSFVMNAASSEESRTIIKSIVDLGNNLQMNTTAEGIEDQLTLSFLKEIQCEMAQGYLISPPLQPAAIENWFLSRERLRETGRIESLNNTNLLDTPAEERFDSITRLAQQLFDTKICLISFVDTDRQWFKSIKGLEITETPKKIAFCTKAIENDCPLISRDTLLDPRFKENPLVTGEPHIRFYAGHPLTLPDGHKVGTLCLIDDKPRKFEQEDILKLKELSLLAEKELANTLSSEIIEYHTGLINRETFKSRAESGLSLCKKLHLKITIISVQLSGLALINQRYGKPYGDEIIKTFADMMMGLTGTQDLVGRYRNTRIAMELIGVDESQSKLLFEKLQQRAAFWSESNSVVASILNYRLGFYVAQPAASNTIEELIEKSLQA